jgi:nucleoside-diphosphate-sugar epimerase
MSLDIRDKNSVAEKLHGFDLAINTSIIQVPEINEKKRLGYEVNILGLQNLCEAVESTQTLRGLLHVSSWHIFGERDLTGTLVEEFGLRPDKIEERARLYALCKIGQETIIRIVAANSNKSYGIIRVGTILGEGMPNQTAANLFIENALHRQPLTPYKHTQYRPMLYVDIQDVCDAFETFATRILTGEMAKENVTEKIINLMWPQPLTIIELARIISGIVAQSTNNRDRPQIRVIDKGIRSFYSPKDKNRFKADISKALRFLGKKKLISPEESLKRIIQNRLNPRNDLSPS